MSLVVNLAVLAEGAATDARGSLTLVSVNPHALIADELPAQFSPVFVMVVEDDETDEPVIIPGRTLAARVEATGPDNVAVFIAQLRQVIVPSPQPGLFPRVQVIAQVPFTAGKTGEYEISARVAILGDRDEVQGEITASRAIKVTDVGSLKSKPATPALPPASDQPRE